MADVADEDEFDSHFLDSMLEVEMTEEDGEVDIAKSDGPRFDNNVKIFPPIPMFDLQKQVTCKNPYESSVVNSGFQNSSLVNSMVPKILSAGPTMPIVNLNKIPTTRPNSLMPFFSVITSKTNPPHVPLSDLKHPIKIAKNPLVSEQLKAARFIRQLFKPEYVKRVFTNKDTPGSISEIGSEELEFYQSCFKDLSNVKYCRIHCTICDKHLGCCLNVEKKLMVHKMLKVLTCKSCSEFYGDGNFPCDTGDNCEIYCRWCGQGGALVCCSFCPRVFCKKCVRRNFGTSFLRTIQKASDWACFCCAQKPLWPHRAVCRALIEYIEQNKEDPKSSPRDITMCCDASILNCKKLKPIDKNKMIVSQGQIKLNPTTKIQIVPVDSKKKFIVPVKSGSEQSILKSNVRLKVENQTKKASGLIGSFQNQNVGASVPPSEFFPAGPAIFTPSNPPAAGPVRKNYPSIPCPRSIRIPVLHGETLITPPGSRNLILPKPQSAGIPGTADSTVKVTLAGQTLNVDSSEIPTVEIPRDVQELVLRITFPDNKVQYVRLKSDGKKCKKRDEFPMPQFDRPNNFLDKNLKNSFELSKRIFVRLKAVKNKAKGKGTGEKVVASAVDKLHFVHEKSMELIRELDETLLKNFEEWKKNSRASESAAADKPKDVPEKVPKFSERCKHVLQSDDSDGEFATVRSPSSRKTQKNKNERRGGASRGKTVNASSRSRGGNRLVDRFLAPGKPPNPSVPSRPKQTNPAKKIQAGKRRKVEPKKGKRVKRGAGFDGSPQNKVILDASKNSENV